MQNSFHVVCLCSPLSCCELWLVVTIRGHQPLQAYTHTCMDAGDRIYNVAIYFRILSRKYIAHSIKRLLVQEIHLLCVCSLQLDHYNNTE